MIAAFDSAARRRHILRPRRGPGQRKNGDSLDGATPNANNDLGLTGSYPFLFVVGEVMRATLFALLVCGLLAAPVFAQNTTGKGDVKPGQDVGDKKGDKGEKGDGKELKILARRPMFKGPPGKDGDKDETYVAHDAKDLLKHPPFSMILEKMPDKADQIIKTMSENFFKADKAYKEGKIDWDKQVIAVVILGTQKKGGMPMPFVKITKAEKVGGKTVITYAVGSAKDFGAGPGSKPGTVGPGGAAALIEKFDGPVEFKRVDASTDKTPPGGDKSPPDKKNPKVDPGKNALPPAPARESNASDASLRGRRQPAAAFLGSAIRVD